MSRFLRLFLFCLTCILALNLGQKTVFAVSATKTETCAVSLRRTDWSEGCEVAKFNTSLGDLKKVTIEYSGYIEGTVRVENKDSATKTITTNYQSVLKLNRPDSSQLLEAPIQLSFTETLPSYDGATDFAGASGRTSQKLTAEGKKSAEYTAGGDFDRFVGDGTVRLIAAATGTMTVGGGSNAAADWDTYARASVKVSYLYEGRDLSIKKNARRQYI